MSKLENLTSKIIQDSRLKADEILKTAKDEAEKIMTKKSESANLVKKSYIDKALIEGENRKQRIISSAELKGRNIRLKAKQEAISNIYDDAIAYLSKMEKNEFISYLKNCVSHLELSGNEEIILSKEFKNAVDDELLKELNLTLSTDNREITGGFVIAFDGIEYNFTFEALVTSQKRELEHEVAEMLFN